MNRILNIIIPAFSFLFTFWYLYLNSSEQIIIENGIIKEHKRCLKLWPFKKEITVRKYGQKL